MVVVLLVNIVIIVVNIVPPWWFVVVVVVLAGLQDVDDRAQLVEGLFVLVELEVDVDHLLQRHGPAEMVLLQQAILRQEDFVVALLLLVVPCNVMIMTIIMIIAMTMCVYQSKSEVSRTGRTTI